MTASPRSSSLSVCARVAVGGVLTLGCAGQQWAQVLPAPRRNTSAVYDIASATTVLFGGEARTGSSTFADTWRLQLGVWQPVAGPGPTARRSHAMSYDLSRARVVLFGGITSSGALLGDTWQFDGASWISQPFSTAPAPRMEHAMVFELHQGRTLLFGGTTQTDTWSFDGVSWTPIVTPTAPVRAGHAMAYDFARGRTVLFGGLTTAALPSNETWEFNGVSWIGVQTLHTPPARFDHGLAYDIARSRTVLFGGYPTIFGSPLADTWEYDGVDWRSITTPRSPTGIGGGVLTHSLADNGVLLMQGTDSVGLNNEAWFYDGANWSRRAESPTATGQSAFDARRGVGVMFAGYKDPTGNTADTWDYRDGRWSHASPLVSPPAREAHAVAWFAPQGRVLAFGGRNVIPLADMWAYDGVTWSPVTTAHAPSPRIWPAMACDTIRGRLVLFGGSSGTQTYINETWEYDGIDWTQRLLRTSPPGRNSAGMAFDSSRGRCVLFGGAAAGPNLGDTWEYDGVSWTQGPNGPPARYGGQLVYEPVRGRIVLSCGGTGLGLAMDDDWEYDGAWVQRAPTSVGRRARQDMFVNDDTGVITLFGGNGDPSALPAVILDTWERRPAAVPTWSKLGVGCAGSNGVPALDAASGSVPALGTTFNLQLNNLPASPGIALLVVGFELGAWNGLALPINLAVLGRADCKAWIAPGPLDPLLIAHGGNSHAFGLPIPATPALAGLVVGLQPAVLDPGAPAALAVGNAGVLRLW